MSHEPPLNGTAIQARPSTSGMARGDISYFRSVAGSSGGPPMSNMGGNRDPWTASGDCSSDENNSPTALNSFNWDKPALEDKSLDLGCACRPMPAVAAATSDTRRPGAADDESPYKRPLSNGYVNLKPDSEEFDDETDQGDIVVGISRISIPKKVEERFQRCAPSDTPIKQPDRNHWPDLRESHNSRSRALDSRIPTGNGMDNRIPLIPNADNSSISPSSSLESDSGTLAERHQREKEELKKFPWYQGDLAREAVPELLHEKPNGSFIVRESSTKPGCYALSLKVPEDKNPSGIAHYLILHTNRGYKIKGFTKEFNTLQALIVHHSVMPELLPCPLAVPKTKSDKEHSRRDDDMDFVETTERRCSVFSDIHWVMTELEL